MCIRDRCNTDPDKNKANREFIIKKIIQIKSGNIDRIALETAVDNLLQMCIRDRFLSGGGSVSLSSALCR